MGISTGYYESSIKSTLKCAREFLHTRSLKTSPVTLFRVKKNMIQCVTEIVPFKSLRAFCIGLQCLHMKQTSIICTGLPFIPPPEADLAWYIQLV